MPISVMKSEFYIQAPFATDTTGSEGYDKLKNLAEHQERIGRTCIVADAMHTRRCNSNSCKPSLCRGDLASQCSDALVTKELLEWARERDNGNPRCTDDLEDTQVADITGGIAESHHLGRCVDAAFVGTEEAKAESKGSIHGIGNFQDEVVPDDTEAFDDEQDLLDKTLLPGSPVSEQQRKQKWLSLPRRARIAVRRLHRNFRHLPKNALVQLLRASRVPKEFIEATKVNKFDVCTATKPPIPLKKVAPPKPYGF